MQITQPFSLNETGGRANNEDCIFPQKGNATGEQRFFIVCDGMGGHENGEVASGAVCESFAAALKNIRPDDFNEKTFEDALNAAYDALDRKDNTDAGGKKMGTTLAFLHISNRQALMAHIGDSRIYHLRKNDNCQVRIIYKSSDHSLVNELLQSGVITEEEAETHPKKNVITRAMQPNQEKRCPAAIHITRDVAAGDRFFLCTDGVSESISDTQLCDIVAKNMNDEAMINVICQQCQGRSRDNFSAYLVSVTEGIDPSEDVMLTVTKKMTAWRSVLNCLNHSLRRTPRYR